MATNGSTQEVPQTLLEELVAAGAHFGRRRSRRHPTCAFAIAATKEDIDIINLAVTMEELAKAKKVLRAAGEAGVMVLWVSSRAEGRAAVREIGEQLGHPYVAGRWLGGTLTNLPEIRERLKRLVFLRETKEKGEWQQRYTKRERLLLDRELRRLEEDFGGILPLLEGEPKLAVVVDPAHTPVAVRELAARHIPYVGLTSTDGNCAEIPYPIVCNVSSRAVVTRLLQELRAAYEEGVAARKEAQPVSEAATSGRSAARQE